MATKHYKDTLEQAQKEVDRQDRIVGWVRNNLKPGMKVRFSGSRSNKGKHTWREVLDLRVVPDHFSKVGYRNPNYVEFKADIPFSAGGANWPRWREEYEKQKKEFRKIHPDEAIYCFVYRKVETTFVISKNVDSRDRGYHSTIVAENNAEFLMEVEIDGVWKKLKELL